jgi:hypothetical protein
MLHQKVTDEFPTRGRYQYVHQWVDRDGRSRLYFRRRGRPLLRLPGPVGGPEFVLAYAAALQEPPLPPDSSLPGGIAAKRGQNPDEVQPLIGVYLLLLKGKIVYVGSSLNMPRRVTGHRSNCRPFDEVFYIATKANQREALERILIKAIHPSQNR